jgi:hypothetical protein
LQTPPRHIANVPVPARVPGPGRAGLALQQGRLEPGLREVRQARSELPVGAVGDALLERAEVARHAIHRPDPRIAALARRGVRPAERWGDLLVGIVHSPLMRQHFELPRLGRVVLQAPVRARICIAAGAQSVQQDPLVVGRERLLAPHLLARHRLQADLLHWPVECASHRHQVRTSA